MQEGHEGFRGDGTFRKALQATDYLQDAAIVVSIATMIHRKSLKEFDNFASLLESRHIAEWNVDVPCVQGRLKRTRTSGSDPGKPAPYRVRSWWWLSRF